jgi:2,5-diketo-D-gluconate reductase A
VPSVAEVPRVALRGGAEIPVLGLGVFQVPPEDTEDLVLRALDCGYRHIDTAASYGNEAAVGQAIRRSGVPRDEVFVTTKCYNDDHGRAAAERALRASLQRLGVADVDLYLIHWPVPTRDLYVETWQALIDLQAEGLARTIGVSNFQPAHLERIVAETGVVPAVNQVELHPSFSQVGLRRCHRELGIATEAWSPLTRGRILGAPVIGEIARRHSRTPGQVVLRWHMQLGNIAIPKTSNPRRLVENLDLWDFELDAPDMAKIATLESGQRIGPDPDTFVRPVR